MQTVISKASKMGEASVMIAGQTLRIVVAGSIKGDWDLGNVVITSLPAPITGANGAINTQVLQKMFALTDAEADAVRAAVADARAAYAARPEAKIVGLPSERRALAEAISAALDREAAQRERCYRQDIGLHGMESLRAATQKAQAALADFDAAHPEVLATLTAQRNASIEHFLATD